jgi:hypothetical protein
MGFRKAKCLVMNLFATELFVSFRRRQGSLSPLALSWSISRRVLQFMEMARRLSMLSSTRAQERRDTREAILSSRDFAKVNRKIVMADTLRSKRRSVLSIETKESSCESMQRITFDPD